MKTIIAFVSWLILASPGSYTWQQMAVPGTGCFQEECQEGQWPMGILPQQAFDGKLWMVGQKKVWSSPDGIHWVSRTKADWNERISFKTIFFKGQLLTMGGLIYQTREMANDIWRSKDGVTWTRAKEHAEWPARKSHEVVEFNNRLWLIGGAVNVDEFRAGKDFVNDVWVSDDGLSWEPVTSNAGWPAIDNPRVVVFQDKMWLLGGAGLDHVWNSADGKTWTKVADQPKWMPRWEYGTLVFDNRMWIFGGHETDKRNAYNDIWHSSDGVHWFRQEEHAPWTPRSGWHSVVFKDQLWIFAGKHTGSVHNWNKDIWAMGKRG